MRVRVIIAFLTGIPWLQFFFVISLYSHFEYYSLKNQDSVTMLNAEDAYDVQGIQFFLKLYFFAAEKIDKIAFRLFCYQIIIEYLISVKRDFYYVYKNDLNTRYIMHI